MKGILRLAIVLLLFAALGAMQAGCAMAAGGGPQLGSKGHGSGIDKSGDKVLQQMIADLVPKFQQGEFADPKTGQLLRYSLFIPADMKAGEKYPLVLFMADASTAGEYPKLPLVQGYGALVWATEAAQKKNPCFVLAPQFSGVAVNDAYERTAEVDTLMPLLEKLIGEHNIDQRRIYATGQSMGGMIAMYLNITYPEAFAASFFVDCHWDSDKFQELVKQNFIFTAAGDKGKSFAEIEPIEEAARKCDRSYTYTSWSARLPQAEQDAQAATMLAKGAPINIFNFEAGTVLPADGKGSEHMYSFDYAYRLTPARDWLFKYSKEEDWIKAEKN